MHPALNIAIRAARIAGNVILRRLDRISPGRANSTSATDFIAETSLLVEQQIAMVIHKPYPEHQIVTANDSNGNPKTTAGDNQWLIAPLDDAVNYMHNFPQIAVSIALQHHGRLEQAVVFDPLRQELFTASRGTGTQLDGRRIRVSGRRSLENALLGTGCALGQEADLERYFVAARALAPDTAGIRQTGAITLDLAYVAAGRLDGFWEYDRSPVYLAAGILLIQEAGGLVTDASGGNDYLRTGQVVAGSPRVTQAMLRRLRTIV